MRLELNSSLDILNQEGTLLYPTDTVWGIGCDATNFDSVSKIYTLKNRSESKSLVVLVSSLHMLKKYVSVSKVVTKTLKKSKVSTTIIYQNPKSLASNVIASDNTVAIRIVQDEFCRKLIKRFGKPIVSTSANKSNHSTPKSFQEIESSILQHVDYIVNLHQDKVCDKPSIIIKVEKDGSTKIIRK